MENSFARFKARWYSQVMCSGSSVSKVSSFAHVSLCFSSMKQKALHTFPICTPSYLMCPFDTMLRLPRYSCYSAEWHLSSGSMHIQLALDARRHRRIYNTSLSFEACDYRSITAHLVAYDYQPSVPPSMRGLRLR